MAFCYSILANKCSHSVCTKKKKKKRKEATLIKIWFLYINRSGRLHQRNNCGNKRLFGEWRLGFTGLCFQAWNRNLGSVLEAEREGKELFQECCPAEEAVQPAFSNPPALAFSRSLAQPSQVTGPTRNLWVWCFFSVFFFFFLERNITRLNI
jgi:hypothetical protein